jgi:hypothetical protein
MNQLKTWLAKYNVTTHSVVAFFASATLAYYAVPPFHALVNHAYQALPGWLEESIGAGVALYAWYRKGAPSA